jgi:hypothetical protein
MYRGINEFKRGYQPRNNLVKDENGEFPQYFEYVEELLLAVIECA